MTIKKLTFCILCFANAANLAADEDLNDKNSSNSGVEENVLTNKNSLNTRKWGNLYILFPFSSYIICMPCVFCASMCDLRILFIVLGNLVTGLIEYKYWFNKKIGISFYTILSPFFICNFKNFFNFSISINLFWCKKNKNIFESSIVLVNFSPIIEKKNFDAPIKEDNSHASIKEVNFYAPPIKEKEKPLIYRFSSDFYLLKYEKDRKFYLIYGMFNMNWGFLYNCELSVFFKNFMNGFLCIIFGFNIIGVDDYRKKKKRAEKLL